MAVCRQSCQRANNIHPLVWKLLLGECGLNTHTLDEALRPCLMFAAEEPSRDSVSMIVSPKKNYQAVYLHAIVISIPSGVRNVSLFMTQSLEQYQLSSIWTPSLLRLPLKSYILHNGIPIPITGLKEAARAG